MASDATARRIPLSDASKFGVSALVREAERGHDQVILRDTDPVAVLMSFERFERLRQVQEDWNDLALGAARMATTSSERYTLDEVLERFGCTREDLADEPESHTRKK